MTHRVELVIACEYLCNVAAGIAKDDEVLDQIKKAAAVEYTLETVSSSGVPLDTISSPVTVRHGMNRSRSAVNDPMRAAMPSEISRAALVRNRDGICDL